MKPYVPYLAATFLFVALLPVSLFLGMHLAAMAKSLIPMPLPLVANIVAACYCLHRAESLV